MILYGPKKGVAWKVRLPLVTFGAGDWKTSPTLAAGDFKIAKDGGALANLTTLPTVAPAASAWILFDLSAIEMNGDIVQLQAIDQTSPKEWEDTGAVIFTTADGIGDNNATGDALLDRANAVEAAWTVRRVLRVIAAAVAGKVSGGPGSPIFRDLTDSKDRITATADSNGNRSAVTLDGT